MADHDTRTEPPALADERTTLIEFLQYERDTLRWKCAGLDPDQLVRRGVEPSSLSLLGLIRHMAEVERNWFHRVMSGDGAPPIYCSKDDIDGDFDNVVADSACVDDAFATWQREMDFADSVIAEAANLDVTGAHKRNGPMSLRWVLVHMIEEYARHNGHADLLRERIDGAVGE